MSDRDPLTQASKALREHTEPSHDDIKQLRERLLNHENVRPFAGKSHTKRLRWILPMAAALVAGTALAATPGSLRGMLDAAERFLKFEWLAAERTTAARASAEHPEPSVEAASKPPADQPSAPPEPLSTASESSARPLPIPAPTARAEPLPIAPTSPPAPTRKRRAKASEPSEVASPPEVVAPSLDLTLYKAAHDLHFEKQAYEEALSHWEAYLKRLPQGTFAIEARYNRALCLLHLARFPEARAALLPFAETDGTGGYRQRDAQRLLEALDQRP